MNLHYATAVFGKAGGTDNLVSSSQQTITTAMKQQPVLQVQNFKIKLHSQPSGLQP